MSPQETLTATREKHHGPVSGVEPGGGYNNPGYHEPDIAQHTKRIVTFRDGHLKSDVTVQKAS